MANPQGIDIASYQGYPDWKRVRQSGISFAITKLTEGTGYVNPYAVKNWQAMADQSILRGGYHYARPAQNSAEDEANWFCTVAGPMLQPGDILALDIEEGDGNLHDWVFRFVNRVRSRMGFWPLIYSSPYFLESHGLLNPDLTTCGLWLASWRDTLPEAPAPWDWIAFWQKSATGSVPGVNGPVDMDEFNGSVDRIKAYGKPGDPTPQPDPTPLDGRVIAIAHLCDVVVPMATHDPVAALSEAKRIREQYVGVKP